MKLHNLTQGTPEWLAYRAQHFNASDAPAMMGCSPYKARAELLRELHTGVPADVDVATQKRFDNGHRAEALARPLAEEIVGEDLYPVTGSEGRLSASFDGMNLAEDTIFEHKALNSDLRAAFKAIDSLVGGGDEAPGRLLPIHHRIQMEQQLQVSGAGRALFMATEWDAEGNLIEERSVWYLPDEELRAEILNGWAQFERDLAAYALPAAAPAAPVGKAPETLPALRIEVTGAVTASNLAEFKATALAAIRSVNRDLKTDADFADADKAIKWCADVEQRLKAAKEHALSQTASIDALFKALDDIAAESKAVRLDLHKLAERRKVEVKEEAVTKARRALDAHIAALNAEIAPMRLQPVVADFAGAIKGKRTLDSVNDALDTTLAAAKIAADAQARGIRANLAAFSRDAAGFEFLFADLATFVHKAADDFAALIQSRIATHKAAEAKREAERQAAEAQRIAAAEQRAREQAEREAQARIAEQQRQQAQAEAKAQEKAAVSAMVEHAATGSGLPQVALAPQPATVKQSLSVAPAVAEPATLTLGMICERLQFTVRADFLADVLHVSPARVEGKRPGTYTEGQFAVICHQLRSHVGAMAELYAGEPA